MSIPNSGHGPNGAPDLPPVQRFLVEQAEHAIDRADTKAATVGAAAIALLTVLVSVRPAGPAGPARDVAQAFLITGLIGWSAGVLAVAAALLPRLRMSTPGGFALSFCDLPEEYDAEELRALAGRAAGDVEDWLLALVHVLGRIAVVKFQCIRLGMALLAASGVAGGVGMFIS